MAQKKLNLSLFYKNKKLDTIKHERDFKNKFFIGSDPNLFWQILNNSFPKQHLFLEKQGSSFKLNLHKSMNLSVSKGNSQLSFDELKSSRLIKGNSLLLNPSVSGSIEFANDWQIKFAYADVYLHRPSAEELKLIKLYGKYAELAPVVKNSIRFLILALIATFVGVYFVNDSLVKWHSSISKATDIKVLAETRRLVKASQVEMPTKYSSYSEDESIEEAEPKKTEAKPTKKPSKKATKAASFESVFGSGSGIAASQQVDDIKYVQQTTVVSIAVPGGVAKSGSGSGSGSGGNAKSSAAKFQSEFGISGGSLTDYKGSTVGSLKDVASSDILGSASGLNLTEVKSSIAGKVGSGGIATIKSNKDMAAIKKQFDAFATKITESEDELSTSYEGGAASNANSDRAMIQQIVSSYSDRLTHIFNTEFRREKIWGSIKFTIYIESNGKVLAVDITPYGKSRFNQNVINNFRNEILTWKFKVSGRTSYVFTRIFTQQ